MCRSSAHCGGIELSLPDHDHPRCASGISGFVQTRMQAVHALRSKHSGRRNAEPLREVYQKFKIQCTGTKQVWGGRRVPTTPGGGENEGGQYRVHNGTRLYVTAIVSGRHVPPE
jgi:hypothetical protein